MTGLEDTLKIIGIAVIGILGIIMVLIILSVLCAGVAFFAYFSIPDTPTVTITPVDIPANYTGINSSIISTIGDAAAIVAAFLPSLH